MLRTERRHVPATGASYAWLVSSTAMVSCSDPEAMQRLADGLTAEKIDALLRKWLALLPHPFAASDRQQGIRYDISMLCKPSSHAPRSSTGRWRDGSSSRRWCARTSTWGAPTTCS